MKRFFRLMATTLTIAAFAAAVLVSCKDDEEPAKQVTKVTVTPATPVIAIGAKVQLAAAVEPADAADKTVTWTSSNESVATVNSTTGEVTGVAEGEAKITATVPNGVNGSSNVKVQKQVIVETGVSITWNSIAIDTLDLLIDGDVAQQETLVPLFEPVDATNREVVWSSEFPEIASVNTTTGVVTAVAGGESKITVTTVNGKTDVIVARVTQPLKALVIDTADFKAILDNTYEITVTPDPANATDHTDYFRWELSNDTVVRIDNSNGLLTVTALKVGEVVITFISGAGGDITESITVTVARALPVADLFDFVIGADGVAYDNSPNKLTILEGPATKWQRENALNTLVQWSETLERYEAVLITPRSRRYAEDADTDVKYRGLDFSEWADVTYQDYRHRVQTSKYPDAYGQSETLGDSKGMGFYKIPWGGGADEGDDLFKAYTSAFSYELVFKIDEDEVNGEISGYFNLFGHINPTHSGFGIAMVDESGDNVPYFEFPAFYAPGNGQRMTWDRTESNTGNPSPAIVRNEYYHVIVTYDKNDTEAWFRTYVNGVNIFNEPEHIGEYLQIPVDYYWFDAEGTNGRLYDPNTTPRQSWMENLWIGGVAHQSGYPNQRWGPNKAHYAIARVYSGALTATQVADLYAAIAK